MANLCDKLFAVHRFVIFSFPAQTGCMRHQIAPGRDCLMECALCSCHPRQSDALATYLDAERYDASAGAVQRL
eukprot:4941694-Prymnesium_polylepis.1